jgi:hypothetical protein
MTNITTQQSYEDYEAALQFNAESPQAATLMHEIMKLCLTSISIIVATNFLGSRAIEVFLKVMTEEVAYMAPAMTPVPQVLLEDMEMVALSLVVELLSGLAQPLIWFVESSPEITTW